MQHPPKDGEESPAPGAAPETAQSAPAPQGQPTEITLRPGASMAEYQRYIHELEALKGWLDVDLVHNCFLMGEEMGELFQAIRRLLKVYPQQDKAPPADPKRAVAEEIVDVFNYLIALANRLDIDLEAAFRDKNAENQGRSWGA